MACGCNKRGAKQKFLWTPPEGSDLRAVVYDKEAVAKAKVIRKGGTYAPVPTAG